ncbi:MAG: hypothetical protein ACHP6H_01880 [Legionellales bacterium]
MKEKKALKEHELVDQIILFFEQTRKKDTNTDFGVALNLFLNKPNMINSDIDLIRTSISIQHAARVYVEDQQNVTTVFPYFYRQKDDILGSASGTNTILDLLIAAILAVCAAAYGAFRDTKQAGQELFYAQRVKANLATLSLSATYVGIAVAASFAIFASNPIGWAIFAAVCLVVGVALLIKVTRLIVNELDAYLNMENSGLASDSRFQLTAEEERQLINNQGFTPDEIEKIREVIRGFAIQASNIGQVGFFGSKDQYVEITNALYDIKRGEIAPIIRAQYQFPTGPNRKGLSPRELEAQQQEGTSKRT